MNTKTKTLLSMDSKSIKKFACADCETTSYKSILAMARNDEERATLSTMFPLMYDFGWVVSSHGGKLYARKNYLVQETWENKEMMGEAYYASKIPDYEARVASGELTVKSWIDIRAEFIHDCIFHKVEYVCAYNAMFDFKKAWHNTNQFVNAVHGKFNMNMDKLTNKTETIARKVLANARRAKEEEQQTEEKHIFDTLRYGKNFSIPVVDIWVVACDFLNHDRYKRWCIDNGYISASGLYFKSSAEIVYRYMFNDNDFVESHTALDDAVIESAILCKILKRKKVEAPTMAYFPFRKLGTTLDFADKHPKYAEPIRNAVIAYLDRKNPEWTTDGGANAFQSRLVKWVTVDEEEE